MAPIIDITKEARDAFHDKLRARGTPQAFIRLGVRGGGCTGYSYVIEYDDTPRFDGSTSWREDGVGFIIDHKSALLLSGSRLLYARTVMSEGFSFENPREVSRCGCGTSFNVG